MYRILAFTWFMVGLALLIVPEVYPSLKEGWMTNNMPMAGFCFALSAYNMIRWRLIRNRQIEIEEERAARQRHRDTVRKIDPTLDFSDNPDDKKSC